MAFQWACFLSYRHSDSKMGRWAVDAFRQAMQDELALLRSLPIYWDERNEPGFLYNEVIATALCESVCMVMMYWPDYFSHEHSYCTREYLAMVALEEKRLAMLPHPERHHGLIIPVVIRGPDDLPSELKDNRQAEDFTDLSVSPQPMSQSKKFGPRVRKIVNYIHGRVRVLGSTSEDPCSGCLDFVLPKYDDVKHWLDAQLKPSPWIRGGRR